MDSSLHLVSYIEAKHILMCCKITIYLTKRLRKELVRNSSSKGLTSRIVPKYHVSSMMHRNLSPLNRRKEVTEKSRISKRNKIYVQRILHCGLGLVKIKFAIKKNKTNIDFFLKNTTLKYYQNKRCHSFKYQISN